MGCFGYICNKCDLSIRGGEKAVLKHIRHGEVLGETSGTYDYYGRVEEDSVFRNNDQDNINNHEEICKSEFDFLDSSGYDGKIYKGKPVQWMKFREIKVAEGTEDLSQKIYFEWDKLPSVKVVNPRSGTEAYHKYCYERTSEEERAKHTISKSDPNQSGGSPRKKYSRN